MQTGLVNDELPVVKARMLKAMRAGHIGLATGYAAILADLEVLQRDGVHNFIVFDDGTVEGVSP